jgi:hypothetical protein
LRFEQILEIGSQWYISGFITFNGVSPSSTFKISSAAITAILDMASSVLAAVWGVRITFSWFNNSILDPFTFQL